MISYVMSSHMLLGNLNTPIMYVGIAWATDLIKTSLAPMDINLSDELDNLFTSCSFADLNFSLLMWPSGVGNPKYLSSTAVHATSKISRTCSF
jgi:hypothetical protein